MLVYDILVSNTDIRCIVPSQQNVICSFCQIILERYRVFQLSLYRGFIGILGYRLLYMNADLLSSVAQDTLWSLSVESPIAVSLSF